MALKAVALVVLCHLSLISLAELPSEYVRHSWRSEDGLPQNTVSSILQSHDGYMWIGTQAGLARFDGMRFLVFNTQNTPLLPSNRITAILEDHQGRLWIGTAGGVVLMRDLLFTSFSNAHGLSLGVSALAEDDQGNIWIGTNYGLDRWANGQLTQFTSQQGLANNAIKALAKSKDGGLWIGTNGGVSHFKDGTFTTYSSEQGLPTNFTRSIYEDLSGSVWVGTSRNLAKLNEARFSLYAGEQGLEEEAVLAIYRDHLGHLWLGTNGSGLFQLVGGKFVPEVADKKSRSEVIETIYEDRQGNLWLGTEGQGLVRLSSRRFTTYNTESGLSHDVVWSVTEDKHNDIWIGTNDGLDRLHEGRLTGFTTKDGLASNNIISTYGDRAGDVWVATTRGLMRFHDGHFLKWGQLFKNYALVLYQGREGNMWAGGGDGLVEIRNGRMIARYGARDGLTHPVRALAEDHRGRLWIGMNGGGVSVLENHHLAACPHSEELSSNIVSAIFADPQDTIWVGTDGGGLNRLEDGRITRYSTRQGLADDSIYSILEDSAQTLWMTSSRGIFRIDKGQLSDFAAGKLTLLRPDVYDGSDGIANSVGTAGVQPGSWKASDGTLWFSTLGGVVKVDPRRLGSAPALPPVVIEKVVIDGKSFPLDRMLELPSGHNNVEFDYTALDFAAPQKVRFRYKLEGFDPGWTDGGTRRSAYYTNLSPGNYRFRVLANNSGIWGEYGGSVSLYLRPHFYQSAWFYGLCASVLVLGGLSVHTLRTKRLQNLAWRLARAVDERTKALASQARELQSEVEERKKAQEDLRQTEQKYRSMFEQAVVGIFQISREGRYLSVNPAMAQMLGYDSAEELSNSIQDISTQIYVDPEREQELRRLAEEQSVVRNFECQLYRKDGSKMWVSGNLRAVRKNGCLACYEGTNQDITERKILEEQLMQSQKMEAVGRLAGGVAHDFNNTIGVIVGYVSLLKEQLVESSRLHRYADEISKAGHRAASLTRQLLAFSRKQVIQPKVLDLNLLVTDAEKMLRRLIGEDIEMKVVYGPRLGRIKADQGQIEQVLMNLAINARDAMPQGGTLIIETMNAKLDELITREYPYAKPGEYVMLSVSDTGCGMDKETQRHIFEPFFTTKAPGQGTGLGLSTVYGIVKQNEGFIWVISEPGKGARFTAYIPRVEEIAQPNVSWEEPGLVGGSEIVLLVEDDESMRTLTRSCLQSSGYTVLDVADGESAIEAVRGYEGAIHLLLTDVVMPGISGHQLAKSLAISKPEMKVLYMSGYTADVISRHGVLDMGVTLIEKPFTKQDLLRKVRQVLDQGSISRAAAGV